MKIIFNFLVLYVLMAHSSLDFELIFSLREHFSSDVVLLAVKENKVEWVKKLFKYKIGSPKAFLGAIHLDKKAGAIIPQSHISTFQNILIASDEGEDFIRQLFELQRVLEHLMGSLVLVLFEENDMSAHLEKFYIPLNYKFLLIKKNFEILDVYQIGENGSKIYSDFSFWDSSKKFETSVKNFHQRRMDLRGDTINMMDIPIQNYTQYWQLFSEIMNFTTSWVPVVYGTIFPNGTKTGLFQTLGERRIDATHHNLKFAHRRAEYFDYILPAYIAETKIYVALNEEINWASFISPFSTGIWISIFAWILIASTTVFIINKYNKGSNPDNSFFNVIKALFYQSGIINTSNISFYIAYLTSYILGIVMVQAYSGVFLSYLTVKKSSPPFEDLKGIIQASSHKILIENMSYGYYHFTTGEAEEAIYIRDNLLLSENEFVAWEDKKSGFEQLCQRKIVFITGTTEYTVNEDCDIVDLEEVLFVDVEGIMVWRGFPYKDIMNDLMKKIQFSGLMKLRRKNKIVPCESSHQFKPLPFKSILSIFLLLIFFLTLSVLIFVCERKWE